MNDPNQLAEPAKKRRWLPRFGMRTVFVLIGLAALAAWWVRSEMLAEQRREELIAEFSKDPNQLSLAPNTNPSWKQRLVARLRGKDVLPLITNVRIEQIADAKLFREFNRLFAVKLDWVQIDADQATPEVLDALARCNTISFLNFPGDTKRSDDTVARLSKLRPTTGFWFWTDRVDDAFLKQLADAGVECGRLGDSESAIQDHVAWFRVTDEGLRAAARLRKLSTLTANRNASEDGLTAFRNHPTLYEVELIGPTYTTRCAEVLATLPKLGHLSLVDTPWTDEAVAQVIASHKIQRLKLHNVEIGEETAAAIGNAKSLSLVDLKNIPLTPELIAAFAKCPIQELTIEGDYDDPLIAGLAPLTPNLMKFSLTSPSTADTGLAWIAKASLLLDLRLPDTSITGATLLANPRRGVMIALTLGGPNINSQTLADLKAMPALRQVVLQGNTIDDEALAALPPTITSITLLGSAVTTDGLKALSRAEHEVSVFVSYAEGSEPPYSQAEIEAVHAYTQGRITVTLYSIPEKSFRELLPKSSRTPPTSDAP